jgi:hypothetical protein
VQRKLPAWFGGGPCGKGPGNGHLAARPTQWKAADELHPTQPARAAFVQQAARDLLEGHAPRYVLRGPARGPLASGPGMTVAPCRTDDLGGGVTGSGRCRRRR